MKIDHSVDNNHFTGNSFEINNSQLQIDQTSGEQVGVAQIHPGETRQGLNHGTYTYYHPGCVHVQFPAITLYLVYSVR